MYIIYKRWKRYTRYLDRRFIPAAKILTWWRRWKISPDSQNNSAVSPTVNIIIEVTPFDMWSAASQTFKKSKTVYHGTIIYFKLSVANPVNVANDQQAEENKQTNTTGNSSNKKDIGKTDRNLLDEAAKPDVIESPANDILISDVEPPDPDDTIYVNKQVNIAQQSQAYCSKQSNCQKLMPNMAIEKTTFQCYTRNLDPKSYSSHGIVCAIDTAPDSRTVFFAADTSCNHNSVAQITLHNLVP